MRFSPKTEDEIAAFGLLKPGMYMFHVLDARDETSKNGNEQIKLTLRVKSPEGMHTIYDYLLEKMAFKLQRFCKHNGLLEKYGSGDLCAKDCLDREGMCEIVIEQGKEKYDGGKYPDKNAVKDYCAMPEGTVRARVDDAKPTAAKPGFDDDIPF